MGLCKCPKRKITNQFCFDHRVNVCEYCMVTNHPKCVVNSYIQWLSDSDYSSLCYLCGKELASEDCVRLACYDVFHWACMDQYARKHPATTAPAGYKCPSCRKALFPQSNLVSPVADVLKEKLASVNWGRLGLGLPLLSEEIHPKANSETHISTSVSDTSMSNEDSNHIRVHDAVVHVEDTVSTFSRIDSGQQARHSVYPSGYEAHSDGFDHDENKYKRKSAMEWFFRWLKSTLNNTRRRHAAGNIYQRYCMAAVILLIILFTVVVVFSKLGRLATADDPSFDPHNNPNVNIQVNQDN